MVTSGKTPVLFRNYMDCWVASFQANVVSKLTTPGCLLGLRKSNYLDTNNLVKPNCAHMI